MDRETDRYIRTYGQGGKQTDTLERTDRKTDRQIH